MYSIRFIIVVALLCVTNFPVFAQEAALQGPYENPLHQEVPFGRRSFYLAPWRSYMDTRNADCYLNGLGFAWSGTVEEARPTFELMTQAGFRHVRIEYGWGNLQFGDDPDAPDRFSDDMTDRMTKVLQAARDTGLRPIILLNAHHGAPCPAKYREVELLEDAPEGSREVRLNFIEDVRPGYSGINTPKQYKNPAMFITAVDPETKTCTLSKPLPVELKAGQKIGLHTLKYRPFSGTKLDDGCPHPAAEETVRAWMQYVKAVCDVARNAMQPRDENERKTKRNEKSDAGFDLEVWNEYSFGSDFLDINRYYDPPLKFSEQIRYEKHGRIAEGVESILPMTVDYCNDPANDLAGVKVISGFANQRPWDNGTEIWPGQAGFSRHYYTGVNFDRWGPDWDKYSPSGPIDALGRPQGKPDGKDWHTVEPGSYFVPEHFARMPEFWHFAYQTEFMTRDLQPFPGPFENHHRFAHPGMGQQSEIWMTEFNFWRWPWAEQLMKKYDLKEDDPKLLRMMDEIGAKMLLRASVFYTHKGVRTITYFAVKDNMLHFGMLPKAYFERLKKDDYELNDISRALAGLPRASINLTTPDSGRQIAVVKRVSDLMKTGKRLPVTRALGVKNLTEHDPRIVFKGDGTPENPDRFHRDDFACLPFQLDENRFAVAYYVVTRDVMKAWDESKDELDSARYDMPEQLFELTLSNVRRQNVKVSGYDPRTGETFSVTPAQSEDPKASKITVKLPATDWPRFLIIEESEPGPMFASTPRIIETDSETEIRFWTNMETTPEISWGPIPGRSRDGSKTLEPGTEHVATIPRLGENAGVRIEIQKDGLRSVWPRWGHDVQGVLHWSPRNEKGHSTIPVSRWPALGGRKAKDYYRTKTTEDMNWEDRPSGRFLKLGEGENSVGVGLRQVESTPEELIPTLSATDRCRIFVTQWNGFPAWDVEIRLDPTAHPGVAETFRRLAVIPSGDGLLVLEFSGTESAVNAQRETFDKIRDGVHFTDEPIERKLPPHDKD